MPHSRICAAISAFEACYARSDKAALSTGSARSKTLSMKTKIRIGPLNTVGGVVTELGKVYRQARRGEVDVGDATRLAMILREIRCALEVGDMEARLLAVEARK